MHLLVPFVLIFVHPLKKEIKRRQEFGVRQTPVSLHFRSRLKWS